MVKLGKGFVVLRAAGVGQAAREMWASLRQAWRLRGCCGVGSSLE